MGFDGPKAAVPAMNKVKKIIEDANFSGGPGRVFPFSKGYAAWETDEHHHTDRDGTSTSGVETSEFCVPCPSSLCCTNSSGPSGARTSTETHDQSNAHDTKTHDRIVH